MAMLKMPKLTIAAKLYMIFALLAVATLALAGPAVLNSLRPSALTAEVEAASQGTLNVERVDGLVYAVVMESRGIYMSADIATAKPFGAGLRKYNARIDDVVKNWQKVVRDYDAVQFAEFAKRIQQFHEFREELVRLGTEVSPAAGREWGDNDANRSVRSALNRDLEVLARIYDQRLKRLYADLDAGIHRTTWILSALALAALMLAAFGGFMIWRAGAANAATTRTESATTSSNEASGNVRDIASAAEELSASVMEIDRQVSHSNSIAAKAVGEAERTNTEIKALDDAAKRIGDVVKLITAIAEQTNLLALNATIEAARAGDAGRGFAVVANEVKALAGQTAKATEEISSQIAGMQQATVRSVDAIGTIQRTIREVGEITATIAAAVTEQGAATREIARSADIASKRTLETADEVARVSEATTDTRETAKA